MDPKNSHLACDSCSKPFEKKKNKRITIRTVIDPVSNKLLVLCNSCGLRFFRAQWRVKKDMAKVATQEEKDKYKLEVEEFTKLLNEIVSDDEIAHRLCCPVSSPKICRCIQRYLTINEQFSGDLQSCSINKARAKELQELCRSAKKLILEKQIRSSEKDEQQCIRIGAKLRSKDYEDFVLSNRIRLKETCSLCERGSQRVLCYSNNFLHKQLKSNSKHESRVVGKRAMLDDMLPLGQLGQYKCCKHNCTRVAASHSGVVHSWRQRSLSSQLEARQVLAEMATPAGGSANCRQFIRYVTGCSDGLLAKVRQELKQSFGFRKPAEHGLKEYWRQKKIKEAANRGTVKCSVTSGKINSNVSSTKSQKVTQRTLNHNSVVTSSLNQKNISKNSGKRTETEMTKTALIDKSVTNTKHRAEETTNSADRLEIADTDQQNREVAPNSSQSESENVSIHQLLTSADHFMAADSTQVSEDVEQIEIIKIVGSSDQFSDTDCSRLVFMTPDGVSAFEFPK